VDLSVSVPFVRTAVQCQSVAQIVPVSGTNMHYFSGTQTNPVLTAVAATDGAASGLGDVTGRLKINVAQSNRIGVAILGEARFPTGDENNLLGSGAFSGRGLGIISAQLGDFNPHFNIGYTVRDAKQQNNSLEANLGFDNLLAPWSTMVFDVLGSWQMGKSKLDVPAPVVYTYPSVRTLDVTNIPSQRDDYMSIAIGFKFATKRGIQIVTNALFPIRDSGLQPSVAFTGGLEYNF